MCLKMFSGWIGAYLAGSLVCSVVLVRAAAHSWVANLLVLRTHVGCALYAGIAQSASTRSSPTLAIVTLLAMPGVRGRGFLAAAIRGSGRQLKRCRISAYVAINALSYCYMSLQPLRLDPLGGPQALWHRLVA